MVARAPAITSGSQEAESKEGENNGMPSSLLWRLTESSTLHFYLLGQALEQMATPTCQRVWQIFSTGMILN